MTEAGDLDKRIFKKSEDNKRGIPEAIFIENVEELCKDREPTQVVGRLQDLHSKYQYMQSSLTAQRSSLKTKLPDISAALEVVEHLVSKSSEASEDEPTQYTYQLAENIWSKASAPPSKTVCLWLGANCMLEYTLDEALDLLKTNETNARRRLLEMCTRVGARSGLARAEVRARARAGRCELGAAPARSGAASVRAWVGASSRTKEVRAGVWGATEMCARARCARRQKQKPRSLCGSGGLLRGFGKLGSRCLGQRRKKSRKKRLASSTAEDAGFNTGEGSPFSPPVSSPEHQAHPDGAFGGAGYDVQTAGYAGYDLGQASQGYPNGHTAAWADSGVSQMEPSLEAADTSSERRAALQTLAGLFVQPDSFVPGGVELCAPHGFDLQAAEFNPFALARPRHGAGAEPGPAAGQGLSGYPKAQRLSAKTWGAGSPKDSGYTVGRCKDQVHPDSCANNIRQLRAYRSSAEAARTAMGRSRSRSQSRGRSGSRPRGGGGGGKREKGTINTWNNDRQFGFVSCDSGRQDLFTHAEYITDAWMHKPEAALVLDTNQRYDAKTRGLRRGDRISFEVEEPQGSKKSMQAVNVEMIDLVKRSRQEVEVGAVAAVGHQIDRPLSSEQETGNVHHVAIITLQGTPSAASAVPRNPAPTAMIRVDAAATDATPVQGAGLLRPARTEEGVGERRFGDQRRLSCWLHPSEPGGFGTADISAVSGWNGSLPTARTAAGESAEKDGGREEIERLQAELGNLREMMAELRKDQQQVKEHQETLGTTLSSLKDKDREDEVLEWWEASPGPSPASRLTRPEPTEVAAGPLQIHGQIEKILTLLQRQQEQQQVLLRSQRKLESKQHQLYTPSPASPGTAADFTWATQAASETASPSVPDEPPGGPWEIDATAFGDYAATFARLDFNQDGFVEGVDARSHFDHSGLQPVDLAQIWALADAGRDGRLSLAEFAVAATLVDRRSKGAELPPFLPPSLFGSASQLAEVSWEVTPEEREGLQQLFLSAPRDGGFLAAAEAGQILERSQLPRSELSQIWTLSDVDGDGRLRFGEFMCAMTLAERRRQGAALPSLLPVALQALSLARCPEEPVEDLPSTGPQVAGADVRDRRDRRLEEESIGAMKPAGSDDALWEPSTEELGDYKQLFLRLVGDADALLGAQGGKEVLERSGLPLTELAAIWYLADVDGDGQLALCEFACAMHLTARRRAGAVLPEELPSPLTRLVAGAVQFPEIANPLPAEDDSRWAIDPELLNQYRQIFDGIERRHADSLSAVEAQEVLQRSRLPNQELEAIWQLSDVDQDGELCFEEFACAIHLASLRREGEELPSQLPQALAASLANSTGGDSTDIWSLDSVELQRYSELFASLPRQGDVLAAEDAKEVLERSGLPTEELRQIWRLADRDGDGALDAGEFALAAALADRRRQGYSLPDVLPPEMLQAIGFGGASDWAMAAEDLQRYRDIFQGLPLQRDGHLRTRDAWQVLERSGLPTEELSAVLRLVGDKDGALTFSQFACALHLLARRRAGALLPSSLPEELAALGDRSTIRQVGRAWSVERS
eukprot:s5463_g2.t2